MLNETKRRKSLTGAGLLGTAIVLGLLAMTTGCANFAQFESAETLDEGETKGGGGVTFTQYSASVEGEDAEGEEVDASGSVTVPAVKGWYRRGISDGLEARIAAWMPLGFRGGLKYQLVGQYQQEGVDVSTGLDISYLRFGGSAGDEDASVNFFQFYLPVQTGYRTGESMEFYFTPKAIGQLVVGSAGDDSSADFGVVPAGTLGAALGSDTQFHVEGTAGYDLNVDEPILTTGIGVSF